MTSPTKTLGFTASSQSITYYFPDAVSKSNARRRATAMSAGRAWTVRAVVGPVYQDTQADVDALLAATEIPA